MFWLKACSKCRGDLFLDNDSYNYYIDCLQCGRRVYLEERIDDLEAIDLASLLNSAELSHSTNQELVLA